MKVDSVEEMGVEIVQVREVWMRETQGLSFFEPFFLLGYTLCDYRKWLHR